MKQLNIITIVVALLLSVSAFAAGPDVDPYVGFETGKWEAEDLDVSEDSQGVVLGIDFDRRMQVEMQYSEVEDLEQYGIRVIATVVKLGNHGITLNLGYHGASYDAFGESYNDRFESYGVGYRWDITRNVVLRLAHTVYNTDEFDGFMLGDEPTENTASLLYVFD